MAAEDEHVDEGPEKKGFGVLIKVERAEDLGGAALTI